MKSRYLWVLALGLIALMTPPVTVSSLADAKSSPVALGPGSELWIEGTSTIHEYQAHSKAVVLEARHDTATSLPQGVPETLGGLRDVVVHVPVASLHSGKAALDKNLQKAMNAERYPEVVFRLAAVPPTFTPHADTTAIRAEGSLTIAATTHPITLAARAIRSSAGVWLEGSTTLRMSEYGIKPPTMMLGTLRVADPVTIRYRLLFAPGADGH